MKTEIKLLRIMYAIIIIIGFLLFFYYNNNKSASIETNDYSYDIQNVEEKEDSITYEVSIDKKYSEETLTKICDEIKKDYTKLYKIKDVSDKVSNFDITFYYNDKKYKEFGNNKS